jgi:membrane peptidoglycan carboxypeptidase
METSGLQSWFFWRWSSALDYAIAPGASSQIAFPVSGPFDERRGYTRLPHFRDNLEAHDFRVSEQARQNPGLARLIRWGIAPPYREPSIVGLAIRDAHGTTLYNPSADRRIFQRFEDVPPLVIPTLLFIENRRIDAAAGRRENPAIDWPRSSKAFTSYLGRRLGLSLRPEGGSTLATQLEKYRHSPGGRTSSPAEKLRQVVGASLEAYHAGRDTRDERTQIIIDYLNTMPLGAAPGVGDVSGLGDGLRTWFAMDLAKVREALERPEPDFEKARAYRHVLALLFAVHAPTHYLLIDRRALESRVDAYARLLRSAGVIDAALLALVQRVQLEFVSRPQLDNPPSFVERKAINAVRFELAKLLSVRRLYDLDGLHVEADSTIDGRLQDKVTQLLNRLASPEVVEARGLRAPHILAQGDPRGVTYSFLLLESRPEGNLVRVQTDTRDAPFDVNEGMKLELGSTAKLRTLAHYLDLMAQLYDELSPLDAVALERRAATARDPLTRWAAATLRARSDLDLDAFLRQSLEREYSASPAEEFFTGGAFHQFYNFDAVDNGRAMSVWEAAIRSTNLVFIRLLRDVARYHEARLPYDAKAVLERSDDPVRRDMLAQIADDEAHQVLAQAYRRYRNLSQSKILARLLNGRKRSSRHLAIVFYAWRTDEPLRLRALGQWLQAHGGEVSAAEEERLGRAYGNPRLTIADFGYLLNRHPLELWCAGELARNPGISWTELLDRSIAARRVASLWLFKTRNRTAQDLRLRARIERDAFARMTPFWRSLGFAFDELVPSYATAIGSSADRPMALAELMGIIVNDGRHRPTIDVHRLSFALGTPYHTVFETRPPEDLQVMRPSVARLLREVLAGVVERGTARSVYHAFADESGTPIRIGGKTGSGDNRIERFDSAGLRLYSRATSRTASFVFYLGDRWFGVITAAVSGSQAARYGFTSSLPLAVLKLAAPALSETIRGRSED